MLNQTSVRGLLLIALLAGGCENAGQGAVSGAGIGALSGLAIGSFTGDAGKGAAIGALAGGVGGAVVGDQNRRRNEEAARQSSPAPVAAVQTPAPPPPPAYSTGQAVSRLIGRWRINGTLDSAGGPPVTFSGAAQGVADKTYFVRLDINLLDPRTGNRVDGTSVLSQTGGRGLDLTNSFSTSPVLKSFHGSMDPSGTVFSFDQVDPPAKGRRIVIRLLAGRDWSADVWDGHVRTESMTFTEDLGPARTGPATDADERAARGGGQP